MKSINYQDYLIESLQDRKEAAGYLTAALDGGDISVFLLALRNVIAAQGGISHIAEMAHKSRTSLYKSLSKNGDPKLSSANSVLMAMGLKLLVSSENHENHSHTSKIRRHKKTVLASEKNSGSEKKIARPLKKKKIASTKHKSSKRVA
jgi:probable addiction module antidote protein